jgi:hypothetical protein
LITNNRATQYFYSFVIRGKEMEFGKRNNYYIVKETKIEEQPKKKKMIVFSRSQTLIYDNAIIGDKK